MAGGGHYIILSYYYIFRQIYVQGVCSSNIVFFEDFKHIPDSGLFLFSLGVSMRTPDFTLGPPDGRKNTSAAIRTGRV